jgi:hypothetical protein
MQVIVPLAGPDFVRPDGSIKALTQFEGESLLQYALNSRPWASEVNSYSFILYDCLETRNFARNYLSRWYEKCSIVYLSTFTRGAAITALAGLSVLDEVDKPLIIDLADIFYQSNININKIFCGNPRVGGIALSFKSQNPHYSFLRCDESKTVVEAVEKKVISDHASAGTYIFRDCTIYLKAVAHAIENETSQTHNGLFYVCPLFNGVLAQGKEVTLEPVYCIHDIKC